MLGDIMSNLGYIGIGGIVFLGFIVFCIVKGGNSKQDPKVGGGNNSTTPQQPTNNTTQQ